MFSLLKKTAAVLALVTAVALPAKAVPVDIELSLVIDVSGSVSTAEYNLQMDGYAAAFRDMAVQNNIANSTNGIAVNVVFFSSNFFTTVLDDFTLLTDAAGASAFADTLDSFARPGGGGTNIYTGVNRAVELLMNNNFDATVASLIDVSGDGTDNIALNQAARDNAVSNGITVNGLAIENGTGSLTITDFYRNNVIGGPGSFVNTAATFNDFETAVIDKLRAETTNPGPVGVPEPSTYAILLLGLIALARRQLKK